VYAIQAGASSDYTAQMQLVSQGKFIEYCCLANDLRGVLFYITVLSTSGTEFNKFPTIRITVHS
jgi:hypothetical protein